jgi:dihydroorotase-like cyclic amidohydrolase
MMEGRDVYDPVSRVRQSTAADWDTGTAAALAGGTLMPVDFALQDVNGTLPDLGVATVKVFMAYKGTPLYTADDDLFEAVQIARDRGLLVLVHAENGDAIAKLLQAQALARGQSVCGEKADLELAVRALHEPTRRTRAWAAEERSA